MQETIIPLLKQHFGIELDIFTTNAGILRAISMWNKFWNSSKDSRIIDQARWENEGGFPA